MTIMLKPTPPHSAMLQMANVTRLGSSSEGSSMPNCRARKWNGLTPGRYRKPHRSELITAGTAYGRKIAVREKLPARVRRESSSSANSRAKPSISGNQDESVGQDPQDAAQEFRVRQRADVVVQTGERCALRAFAEAQPADLLLLEAEHQRVDDGRCHEDEEQDDARAPAWCKG